MTNLGSIEGATAATHIVPAEDVLARFTIPGNPRPKGRPKFGKGRTYTPEGTVIAESTVLAAFTEAYPDWVPVEHKVELEAIFFRDSKRVVDVDNLAKLIQDALNKTAFKDDSQVFDLRAGKWFTTKARARTEVVITRVHGDRVEVAG